jgi:very-short-patch-repair endonuclease
MSTPDCIDLIDALRAHGVRLVIVGGYAVGVHGHPRATKDLVVSIEASAETKSETLLWAALCRGQLGVGFRRQYVIAERYIVDFAAPSVKLAVEVDGGYHAQRRKADARRDRVLAGLGWRVVRVEAESVEKRLAEVVAELAEAVRRG